MPRRRTVTSSTLNINLTPLLDVVLQLITFFMMLVHFGARLERPPNSVNLPVAAAKQQGSELTFDRLAVALDAQGRLSVGGRALERKAEASWWAAQAAARRADHEAGKQPSARAALSTQVFVWADRAAPYGSVRRRLADARSQGFVHFSLIVERERGE
jgi:biopolymer transport protein ExbD